MNTTQLKKNILDGAYDAVFTRLYGEENLSCQRQRYTEAVDAFETCYGCANEAALFSVPGRREISGNHTDHNHGKVIPASVDLDIIAVAAKKEGNVIRVKSEGFDMDTVDTQKRDNYPKFSSAALIAGVIDGFEKRGFQTCSFDAYTTSNVFKGSGLSSSAAFENMIGTIVNHFANEGAMDFVTLSQISQYAENVFFGKPSGLMDQIACAAGGFVGIDFQDPTEPKVERLNFDLSANGYSLAIVNTGGNHAALNDEYTAITVEMRKVSKFFGKDYLRDITKEQLLASVSELRQKVGDRAILRALHFTNENLRVTRQLEALEQGNLADFFADVKASGQSSLQLLQNIFCCSSPEEQGLTLALSLCQEILSSECAWRVHGGGFAGTIQVFLPTEQTEKFKADIEQFFGKNSCFVLRVRTLGALCLTGSEA